MASNWWIETSDYRVVVQSDGKETVHEATFSSDHSPDPEDWADCSCGFSVSPRRHGALGLLHDHFRDFGAADVKPIRTRSKSI